MDQRSNAAALTADFAQLETRLDATIGLAVSVVGSLETPMMLGHWQSGPAWSTMKVPVAIAALRELDRPKVTDAMIAAITQSDNAAAEALWQSLGDPVTAARKVEAVLRESGDPTIVQSHRIRAEFTAFGQTEWPLAEQARFTAIAFCDSRNAPIFALMNDIADHQRWGIGVIPGTRFKGGWGPSPSGDYLVRQIGLLTTPTGMTAVALAAQPASGSFADGTHDLTAIANWLAQHLGDLPAGKCDR